MNFLEYNNEDNIYFYNTWNWWHKKVFGNILFKENKSVKMGIINLCGYHSKRFLNEQYTIPEINDFGKIIHQASVIVFVWKSTYDIISKKYPTELENKPFIILTKGNQFGKTNTLEQILSDESISARYNEKDEKNAINELKEYFKEE